MGEQALTLAFASTNRPFLCAMYSRLEVADAAPPVSSWLISSLLIGGTGGWRFGGGVVGSGGELGIGGGAFLGTGLMTFDGIGAQGGAGLEGGVSFDDDFGKILTFGILLFRSCLFAFFAFSYA